MYRIRQVTVYLTCKLTSYIDVGCDDDDEGCVSDREDKKNRALNYRKMFLPRNSAFLPPYKIVNNWKLIAVVTLWFWRVNMINRWLARK